MSTRKDIALFPPVSPGGLLWLALVIPAVLILYGQALVTLAERWIHEEQYNFALLLPLIAAWHFWRIRGHLQPAAAPPPTLVVGLFLLVMLLEIAGLASSIFYLQHLSFLGLLFAIAVQHYGLANLRRLLPVFLFLFLSIPLPYVLEAALTWRLQGLSAALGSRLIAAFGIPVFLDGNILELSQHRLQVAEACSGLNYLYPLVGLGAVIAVFSPHKPRWARWLTVISAVPIAIVMNGLRIGAAGILATYFGEAAEESFQHLFQGWVVFLLSLGLMLLLMHWLPERPRPATGPAPTPRHTPAERGAQPILPAVAVPLVLGLLLLFQMQRAPGAAALPDRLDLASFPARLGAWQVVRQPLVPDLLDELAADDSLAARLIAGHQGVDLFIAYYARQQSGQSPHSPKVCMPGGGWEIMDTRRLLVPVGGQAVPVNRVRIVKRNTTLLVYYWYYGRGKWLASEWRMKWELFRDALAGRHTNNALVRLSAPVASGDPGGADRALQSALQALAPQLPLHLD